MRMRERIYLALGAAIILACVALLGVYMYVSPLVAIYGAIITVVGIFIILIATGSAR